MKAVTWHGVEDVRVDSVPDPRIEEPTDAIVRITSTAICGSDLHLYSRDGPGWIRTNDLGIKSPLLCQLSYRPGRASVGREGARSGRRAWCLAPLHSSPGPHRLAAQVTALSRL
jgi:hypothetical protein